MVLIAPSIVSAIYLKLQGRKVSTIIIVPIVVSSLILIRRA